MGGKLGDGKCVQGGETDGRVWRRSAEGGMEGIEGGWAGVWGGEVVEVRIGEKEGRCES